MSQKNLASYGDMETLLTEVASKCGPYTEISYEDWLQLTPYQQEHGRWDVTGVPGADGTVSIDLMTKLWENPNPSASFGAQNITLSSSDYDLLLLICKLSTTYLGTGSYISPKGAGGKWDLASYASNGAQNWIRFTAYVNDTTINIHDAYKVIPGGSGTVTNDILIPYQIYGIKLHHTVEIVAIAPTASTLAKKCVFDPTGTDLESTNVEDVVKELEANFQAGVDDIYDAVVAKGSTPASHSLSDVVAGIGNIPTGASATLIGTYSGNKTINVSSYKRSTDTVNNFIIEITSVGAGTTSYKDTSTDWIRPRANFAGSSPTKSLSGNNLVVSNASTTVYLQMWNSSKGWSNQASATCTYTYKVWHV